MSKVTYRGVNYDTDRNLTKEGVLVKVPATYRGIKYYATAIREVPAK